MSDERDSDEGRGALLSRPQRPSGKRSRQRAGGTALAEIDGADEGLTEQLEALDGSGKSGRAIEGAASRNPFVYVWTYLRQVVAEMRKVIWPSRREMVNYTAVVLAFLVFMVALIGGAEIGLAKLVLLVFG